MAGGACHEDDKLDVVFRWWYIFPPRTRVSHCYGQKNLLNNIGLRDCDLALWSQGALTEFRTVLSRSAYHRRRESGRLHHTDPDSESGHSHRAPGPRFDRNRANWNREDSGLCPAHLATTHDRAITAGARCDTRSDARARRTDSPNHR